MERFFFLVEQTQQKGKKKGMALPEIWELRGQNVGNRNTVRFGPLTNFLDFFTDWVSPS